MNVGIARFGEKVAHAQPLTIDMENEIAGTAPQFAEMALFRRIPAVTENPPLILASRISDCEQGPEPGICYQRRGSSNALSLKTYADPSVPILEDRCLREVLVINVFYGKRCRRYLQLVHALRMIPVNGQVTQLERREHYRAQKLAIP